MKTLMKKYFMEFIGTFVLMLTIGCVLLMGVPGVIPALAIGGALMIMVYAGGHVSGGHYNPAVSLAAALRGALSWGHIAQYWIAQILGACAAAYTVMLMVRDVLPNNPFDFNIWMMFAGEALFTFVLAFVVLQTATTYATERNSFFGLAIGSSVMVGIFAVGSICAGAFNPAVALGLGILRLISWKTVLITTGANLVGASIAALLFKATCVEYRD